VARLKPNSSLRIAKACCWALLALSACAPTTLAPPPPTLTLVPVSPTWTPSPIPPTATLASLPQPLDLTTPTALTRLSPLLANPDESWRSLDVLALRTDLAQQLNASAEALLLVEVRRATWTDESFGCLSDAERLDEIAPGWAFAWLLGNLTYEQRLSDDGRQRLCPPQRVRGELLIRVDAVAAEFVLLAQQRLAESLDLPVRRLRLLEAQAFAWPDTSLGCPQPDQTYEAATLNGYRFVFQVGESTYAFHSDSERLLPCPAGREALPNDSGQ